jgi:methyl-accepting chemotaxis protein
MLSISRDLADSYAREYANLTSDKLNYYANSVMFTKTVFEDYNKIPYFARRDVLSQYLKSMLEDNPRFLSVWSILEPTAIDTLTNKYKNKVGSTVLGNFRYVYYRQDDQIVLSRYVEQNPDEVLSGSIYTQVKRRMQNTIVDPYYYSYSGNKSDEILETNIVSPVVENGRFLGVIGVDVPLSTISEMINKYKPIEGSFSFLLSHTGTLVSFPDQKAIGKKIQEIGFLTGDSIDIVSKLNSLERFSYSTKFNNEHYYIIAAPVKIMGTNTAWYVNMALPESKIVAMATKTLQNAILVALFGLILLSLIIFVLARNISRPIKSLTSVINQISLGEVSSDQKLYLNTGDEVAEMAEAMNQYIDGYAKKVEFASSIGSGDLDKDLELLSEEDLLGKSLMQMRNNLKAARQEEFKRQDEDKIHRWVNEGIAKFADILRQNNDDIAQLSFELMRNVVNYLEVTQGAIFVIDESKEEIYYEATSTIAFNKKQFNKTRIKYGEDLIGRCAHEKKTIYLKEVPENYISITSGMGEANPNVVLIVPAILNDKVYAIIELASFKEIKDYQIEFLEKIGESIASTIANVKVSERTQQLLKESQFQQEELSSQEEEMRQNLEELQTTQEEAARREFEMRNLIEALSVSNFMVEYNLNGIITEVNERFAKLVGVPREQIIGMNHNDGLRLTGLDQEKYRKFWEDLRHGITRSEETEISYNDKKIHLFETYTPLLDQDDNPYKIVKIAVDITDKKQIEKQLADKEKDFKNANKSLIEIQKQKDILQTEIEKLKEKTRILEEQLKKQPKNAEIETKDVKSDQKVEILLPPAGSPLITFTDAMLTDIKEMDEQHQKIVELADAVYIGLRTEKPKKDVKESLKMLVDFSAWHFSNEERYFEEYSFDHAKEHTLNHKIFHDRITDFSKKYQSGKVKFYDEAMMFIKNWIEMHFAIDDQKYVELFKSKGM